MAVWSLLHMNTPLNTVSGTGQVGELTMATSRSLKFSLEDGDTLSFSLPGRHPQTREVIPLLSDVLAFRDGTPVQRFRVVSRKIDWGGEVTVTFSAVSYKTLINAWVLHDGDKLNWPVADGALNAATVAWSTLNAGQTKTYGNLGVTQGHVPTAAITLTAGTMNGPVDAGTSIQTPFFAAGTPRSDAIEVIAGLSVGFDWDINIDPANPYTALKFNVWSRSEHGRHQHYSGATAIPSPFVLDDGGNVLDGSHTSDPSTFGNVIRFSPDAQAFAAANTVPTVVWKPTSENPAPVSPATDVPEGRWERNLGELGYASDAAAASAAQGLLDRIRGYTPLVSCSLRRGRWGGPGDLWLGDEARFLLTVPVDDAPGVFLLNMDELVRVYEISVSVDGLGAEDVGLSLNRRDYSTVRDSRALYDRVARLERR